MSKRWALVVVGLPILFVLEAAGARAGGESTAPAQRSGEHKRVGEILWVDVPGRAFAMKETLKSGERKEISFVLAPDGRILIRGKPADLKDMKAGDSPVRSPNDARYFASWIDRLIEDARSHPGWNDAAESAEVLRQLDEAKAIYESQMEGPRESARAPGRPCLP